MSWYLRHITAERYGALANRVIGPFSPGLNVVYGPNEAGKSTAVSLVGGVLFGWEEARGVLNTYRPEEGERAGSLEFADADSQTTTTRLSRAGQGGLQGDARLLADVDRSTFRTVFSLNSEELRSLRTTSDVTARLLTAGSGTGSSPSSAYVEVEQRIAALTSNASDAVESIPQLTQRLEEQRVLIDAGTEQAKLHRQQHRELQELRQSRAEAAGRIDQVNREIENLVSCRSELEALDARQQQWREEREGLRQELAALAHESAGVEELDERLLTLDSASERSVRDKLDDFAEAVEKAQRIADTAKENATASTAAYEALVELGEDDAPKRSAAGNHMLLAVATAIPTVVFALAGIYLFVRGRSITSLSFTALGIGLIVLAFLLAAGALMALIRPVPGEGQRDERLKDAQWVMLQDGKKRDSSQAEVERLAAEIAAFLEGEGLAAANGSIRQARSLLDEARETRARRASDDQRAASLSLRVEALDEQLERLAADRSRACENAGLAPDAVLRDADDLVREKSAQRDALLELSDGMSMRYGELSRTLEQAKDDQSFNVAKLEAELIRTRLREQRRQLVQLLLAKRMLERSIAAWESSNQPEVYAEASRLLALITDGAWVKVGLSASGSLVATSSDGVTRKPRHLSLGTCQQLYLALRVALMLCAQDVGRSVPVIADDILVNFDSARRSGAARVLAELAAKRQVIVFTCHEETVKALREAAAGNVICLDMV